MKRKGKEEAADTNGALPKRSKTDNSFRSKVLRIMGLDSGELEESADPSEQGRKEFVQKVVKKVEGESEDSESEASLSLSSSSESESEASDRECEASESRDQVADFRVRISWHLFKDWKKRALMFNSPGPDSLRIQIWGAPSSLIVHRIILEITPGGFFQMAPFTDNKEDSLLIPEDVMESLYGREGAASGWKALWIYFGLRYGLVLGGVHQQEGADIWMTAGSHLPLSQLLNVMTFCNYVGDDLTLSLMTNSLDKAVSRLAFPGLPLTPYMDQLLEHALRCDLFWIGKLTDTLIQYVCQAEPLSTAGVRFIVAVLRNKLEVGSHELVVLKNKLHRYETDLYQEGGLLLCTTADRAALTECFLPLTPEVWRKAQQLECKTSVTKGDILLRNGEIKSYYMGLLCNAVDTGTSRLQIYWKHIFPNLPAHLEEHLFLSGSVLPMCMLSFYTSQFRVAVSNLFSEANVDVYVYGACTAVAAAAVQVYLKETHPQLYVASPAETVEGLTTLKLVLPSHPLFHNQSLRLCIHYYSSPEITPEQIVTYHHLCPVRAFYLPAAHQVYLAPSAFNCWSSGYMSEYRVRGSETASLHTLATYAGRKFGVWKLAAKNRPRKSHVLLKNMTTHLCHLLPLLQVQAGKPWEKNELLGPGPEVALGKEESDRHLLSKETRKFLNKKTCILKRKK